MEAITTVFTNAVSAAREEEYNNWYTYVHLRDVFSMPGGHIAVQRFWRDKYQPDNFDLTFKFYTLYELSSKDLSTQGHQDFLREGKLPISTAMDLSHFKEDYWDPQCGSADWAEYADYAGDKSVFVATLAPIEGGPNVDNVLTKDVIVNKLAKMDGAVAAHLFQYGTRQMPKRTATPEHLTHQLVLQLKNSEHAAAAWNAFVEETPAMAKLETHACIYAPVMPRIRDVDFWATPEIRAIAALSRTITTMPGMHYEMSRKYNRAVKIDDP